MHELMTSQSITDLQEQSTEAFATRLVF